MPHETWSFSPSASLTAMSAYVKTVTSDEPIVLKEMLDHFKCKTFFLRAAQAFPAFPLQKANTR